MLIVCSLFDVIYAFNKNHQCTLLSNQYLTILFTAMSTNTKEEQELLRLFKCVIDTGADVLVPFAEHKLLKSYNGNFERFLNDKKHEMFHLWQSKKLLCCECPPAGCKLKRTGHMDNWIFRKIYDNNGHEDGGHIVRKCGKVIQVCLHKYVTRIFRIHELDISALSFLLRNLATLLPNENTALDTITTYRSHICHAYSTNCYPMTFLNTAWTELENALVELIDPSYKVVIQKQIKYLRKIDLEKEEITELLKNVQDGIADVKYCMSSTINAIEKCETTVKESTDKILENIDMLKTNQASDTLAMSERLNKMEQFLHQLHSTAISVKYEKSSDLSKGEEECLVLWQLATPENWNAVEIEQMLTMFVDRFKDLQVKIKFVRNGSLVIMTTVPSQVANDSTDFQCAVKAFLTRMIEVCQIDTKVSCNVDVTLHILNSNKLNVLHSFPNKPTEHKFVQTDVVELSTNPYQPDFDDGSPIYGDDTTFCCSCLQSNKQVATQSYCLDCSEPICEKCSSIHETFEQPHTITSKVTEDIVYQSNSTVSTFCSVHKNQVTNSFCTQHDALLCDICVMDGHSSCVSVLSIQKAAENVAEGAIMGDLENRLHNLGIVIESLITTEEKNILHVNAEKEKVHKEANSIRQRISSHLDRLERKFADRLTDVAERCKLSHNYYLPSKLRITKILKNEIQSTKTFESEADIFKALKILDRKVNKQESEIRNFQDDMQVSRRLEFYPSKGNIELKLAKLGDLKPSKTPMTSLDCQSQLHLVRNRKGNIICVDSFKSVNIGCSVGSGIFINGGKLIFTNYSGRHCLHVCKRNGMGCEEIKLDGGPMDIATYNSTIVLATYRYSGIQIIHVDTNKCGQYIRQGSYFAIQCENKNIWTSTGEAEIYRIDIKGTLLQNFKVDFIGRQIALDITGEHMFYSLLKSDKIFTLSADGKPVVFYTCPENVSFHGLAVDCNGNVLIADTNSNCIRSISKDGKNIETILSIDDGISKPDHLQINSDANELLVLSLENGFIQIFKLI